MVEQISNALGPRVPDQLLIEKPFYFNTAWIQCFVGYLKGTPTIPKVQKDFFMHVRQCKHTNWRQELRHVVE